MTPFSQALDALREEEHLNHLSQMAQMDTPVSLSTPPKIAIQTLLPLIPTATETDIKSLFQYNTGRSFPAALWQALIKRSQALSILPIIKPFCINAIPTIIKFDDKNLLQLLIDTNLLTLSVDPNKNHHIRNLIWYCQPNTAHILGPWLTQQAKDMGEPFGFSLLVHNNLKDHAYNHLLMTTLAILTPMGFTLPFKPKGNTAHDTLRILHSYKNLTLTQTLLNKKGK